MGVNALELPTWLLLNVYSQNLPSDNFSGCKTAFAAAPLGMQLGLTFEEAVAFLAGSKVTTVYLINK